MNPELDGVDHINVYSKGKTELGRLLSNFAHTPFECTDGKFESVEGYWYWLLTDPGEPRRDELKRAYGFKAKQIGRELLAKDWPDQRDLFEFRENIFKAIYAKVRQHDLLGNLLKDSALPFYHYYVYGSKVVPVGGAGWIMDDISTIRYDLQNGVDRNIS